MAFEKMKQAAQALKRAVPLQDWLDAPESREGELHLKEGKFADAEECFQRAAAQAKARSAAKGRYLKILVALAMAQRNQGKLADARETIETALELLEEIKGKAVPEVAACYDLLGGIQQDEGDFSAAVVSFGEALEAEKTVKPPDSGMLVERYRRLAGAYAGAGSWESAGAMLGDALDILDQNGGDANPALGGLLLEIARVEEQKGNHAARIGCLERAFEIHKRMFGAESVEVAQDYQLLAAACRDAGDLERAVFYYERALYLRECQLGGSATELAVILMGLADTQSRMGRTAPAMELLQQAVGRLEGTRDEGLGRALESLARMYQRVGRYQDAASCARRARSLWEEAPDRFGGELDANSALLEEVLAYLAPEDIPTELLESGVDTGASVTLPPKAAPSGARPSRGTAFAGGGHAAAGSHGGLSGVGSLGTGLPGTGRIGGSPVRSSLHGGLATQRPRAAAAADRAAALLGALERSLRAPAMGQSAPSPGDGLAGDSGAEIPTGADGYSVAIVDAEGHQVTPGSLPVDGPLQLKLVPPGAAASGATPAALAPAPPVADGQLRGWDELSADYLALR